MAARDAHPDAGPERGAGDEPDRTIKPDAVSGETRPGGAQRDDREASWAPPVERFRLGEVPADALNANVEGRQPMGALQGFGRLWQKTYGVRLAGVDVTPVQVIDEWKHHFGEFWPAGNYFMAPVEKINPGDVALLNLATVGSGGPVLSTGVRVIYADDESFTFMNPQGHMFAGWITFSSYEREGATVAQIQVLIRTSDPAWELSMRLVGFRREDAFWHATLRNLARHFGVPDGQVWQKNTLVDSKLQWSKWTNIRHNAAMLSFLRQIPIASRRLSRRHERAVAAHAGEPAPGSAETAREQGGVASDPADESRNEAA